VNYDKNKEELIQCAACGYVDNREKFYNSVIHNKFKICPCCGTVRYVCEENIGFRKIERINNEN